MSKFKLPHNDWTPRPHQMPLWRYLQDGGTRAIAVWHRRCGKDDVMLHHCAVSMATRVGNYWHALPEFNQARKSVWAAVNPHTGKRRIHEMLPSEFVENIDDHAMFVRAKNGSTFQLIGSDRYDATVGSGVAGITYSEWALSNPSAWAYHRPMLQENNGWAAFITTPRGRNHAKTMYDHALRTPGWFAEMLTVHDTEAMTREQQRETLLEMQALYGEAHGLAAYRQEYECSWEGHQLGSIFGHEIAQMREEGRVLEVEPDLSQPVVRSWDIGMRDDTSVWWAQPQPSGQLLVLDHLAASGMGIEWWRDQVFAREQQRGWIHGNDYVPHDAKVREWGTGRTRVETMVGLGLKPILVPLATVEDGINAVRRTLPVCVFHPRTEDGGLSALEQYRREWDDDNKCFKANPLHDWTSNPADSFRYLAQAWRGAPKREVKIVQPQGWIIPPIVDKPYRGGIRL